MSRTALADQVLTRAFRDELDQILHQHNRKVFSATKVIPRDCSVKTRKERRDNIRRAFAELNQIGYRLTTPLSLKQKHLLKLGEYWQAKGLAPKTLHGLFSNLRQFARWVGKRDLVEDIGMYCGGREHLVRKTAAEKNLAWEAQGIDVEIVLTKAKTIDERLWLYLSFQRFFGLRTRESIELRPWRATALGDEHLYVTDGTKGGRHRIVPIRTERQRELIAFARNLVGPHMNAQLRWPDKNWRQAQSHFYYLVRKLGVSHGQSGISPHGLRHGYLQDQFEHYAGIPAPIKGGDTLPENPLKYRQARLATSLVAGHFREAVTGSYCGSLGHKLRQVKQSNETDGQDDLAQLIQESSNEEVEEERN